MRPLLRLALALAFLTACSPSTAPVDDAGADAPPGVLCTADEECDDATYCNGQEQCDPGATGADASGCVAGTDPCGGEACDEDADACGGPCGDPDADDDGDRSISCGGGDCDDADPDRRSTGTETCDSRDHDEDCDPETFGFRDADMDGRPDLRCCNVGADGMPYCGNDCDDMSSAAYRGATEVCDTADNDCDGAIDEGVSRTFYPDADGDGYGARDGTPVMACDPPTAHEETNTDCDDAAAVAHPGGVEDCARAGDEDCDGTVDEGCSCGGGSRACPGALGACAAGTQTCVGASWSACSISPIAETCNGTDDDCDGATDEAVSRDCWLDADGDGVPAPGEPSRECATGAGACPSGTTSTAPTSTSFDCADSDNTSTGARIRCYDDGDGDGFAATGAPSHDECYGLTGMCGDGTLTQPSGASTSDCNDAAPGIRPSATEVCNGADDDCDGANDECATVMRSVRACMGGACVHVSCTGGYAECNGVPDDGCETDAARDPANCGGCGIECAAGQACCSGTCTDLGTPDHCTTCSPCPAARRFCCEIGGTPACVSTTLMCT